MRFTAILGAAALVFGLAVTAQTTEAMTYKVVDKNSIPKSLTGKAGDPKRGKILAVARKKGNCLACHKMPIPKQLFHGLVGPTLVGIGSRYKAGELRLRVVDPKQINPDSIMPSFYKSSGFHRPLKKFKGKSVLKAQEIEDIVAYLRTLKEPK